MPNHTPLPTIHSGESELATRLLGMGDPAAHFWFGLNHLPGVKDVDLLLLHERVGLFVVEVKAISLKMIDWIGMDRCHIHGRPEGLSPQMQAYYAAIDLRNYLTGRTQLPFVISTVCWPQITRREWNESLPNPRLTGEYAESMIFKEDLAASSELLLRRLQRICEKPLTGDPPRYPFRYDPRVKDDLRAELRPEARPQPTPSDLARLHGIERDVAKEADRDAPTEERKLLLYTGLPGTGKTFRLLRIALRHAVAGRRVLFACYNKVLATDLRRLMSYSQALQEAPGSVEIRDVYELLQLHAAAFGISVPDARDADEWGELVAQQVLSDNKAGMYDTLLVDEGQDLRQWAFDLLEGLATSTATLAVAAGRGQELYGEPAPWLSAFKARAREIQLRRNFRNTRPVFQLAHTLFEAGLDTDRMGPVLARFRGAPRAEQLEFLREKGDYPEIRPIDDSKLSGVPEFDHGFGAQQHETMVNAYEYVLRQELASLRDDEWPMDLLVLVPGGGGSLHRKWAADAMRRMQEEYDFVDYTVSAQRRVPARPLSLRLCTFHSSRGIEGTRVVIFGLEQLETVARQAGIDTRKLAYITLSRSIAECIIVVPHSRRRAPVIQAVQYALTCLQGFPGQTPSAAPQVSAPSQPAQVANIGASAHHFVAGACVRCGKQEMLAVRFGWGCQPS